MDNINIGEKILEYRNSRNLSIRELSQAANVTSSLLSQIERGLANPSINTLKLIAKSLNVPLFYFFIGETSTKDLIVKADKRKKIIFPENNSFSYELLSPDLSGNIEFSLMNLSPNSCSSDEPMCHEGEEAAYIIEGVVKLYLSDDVFILDKGDSVKIPPLMKHKWENAFSKSTTVIFAVTPPSF